MASYPFENERGVIRFHNNATPMNFTSAMSFFTRRDARFAFVYMAPAACFTTKQERSEEGVELLCQKRNTSGMKVEFPVRSEIKPNPINERRLVIMETLYVPLEPALVKASFDCD